MQSLPARLGNELRRSTIGAVPADSGTDKGKGRTMSIKFESAEVPASSRANSGPSEYADSVKDLATNRDKAIATTVPTGEVETLLRTFRHDADLLNVNATIRARKVSSKDGKTVHLTLWAVDKIRQNRAPRV